MTNKSVNNAISINNKAPKVTFHQGGDFHWVGNGFPVRTIFNYTRLGAELSPFLLLDYAAPYTFTPSEEKRGVGAHPHRGFETVTIVYQGELEHRDSGGGGGIIGPGDVQWMTAASGLIHEEFHTKRFTKEGGVFEVAQLWVNLPAKNKSADPGYQTLLNTSIPKVKLSNVDKVVGELRVIAGEFHDNKGPAKTFIPINIWDVRIEHTKEMQLTLPKGHTKVIVLLRGQITINNEAVTEGNYLLLERESNELIFSVEQEANLLILTGEPINEPIVGRGPFVMNTQSEIEQAFKDFNK
jgi:quercetin 2,3-dioxygenase